MRFGVLRVQLHRTPQRLDGLLGTAVLHQCQPEIVVRLGIPWLQFDGVLDRRQCLLRPAGLHQRVSELVMAFEARRIALNELAVLAYRLLESPLGHERVGACQRRGIRRDQL